MEEEVVIEMQELLPREDQEEPETSSNPPNPLLEAILACENADDKKGLRRIKECVKRGEGEMTKAVLDAARDFEAKNSMVCTITLTG